MSKREKLVQRFLTMPRDFTWQELVALLGDHPATLDVDGNGGGDGNELLVLDQFEEMITTWAPESREKMVDRLACALERGDGRLRAVLTALDRKSVV